MSDNTEEILDKIEEGHRRGEHYTWMAGCSLCTEQFAGGGVEPAVAGEDELDEIPAGDELVDLSAARARRGTTGPVRQVAEGTLGDVALEDAQQALDELEDRFAAATGYRKATVHALVGVVRALAGIEEAIRSLDVGGVLEPGVSGVQAPERPDSLRIVETPAPGVDDDNEPEPAA